MLFSSAIFLWLFLPLVFWANYFIQPKYSNILLLISSLIFYAWGEPYFVYLMILSVFVNWMVARGIYRFQMYKRMILFLGILYNLAVLLHFKYAGFGVQILNRFLSGGGQKEILTVPQTPLPIGISFFTFQAVSYIVDVYRGETKPQEKWVNVALYISFFPQLIAGPIVKHREIHEQIENRQLEADGIADGFRRFIYGLAKKVLVSNILGKSADMVFAMDAISISGQMAWAASVFYTLQIYYDFSGYSDMAIGLGKMFGFELPENFNYPYLSESVREFWRRWHISLSTWFKEYVYIPLGGNRTGSSIRTYCNLCMVFFLTGLWHGAGFSFIVWGLYHGFFSILERAGLRKVLCRIGWISHVYLMLIVNFGWIIFRAGSLMDALILIKRMLMPWAYTRYDISIWEYMDMHSIFIFVCAFAGMGIVQKVIPPRIRDWWKGSVLEWAYCVGILVLCLANLAGSTYNPFIYFQF